MKFKKWTETPEDRDEREEFAAILQGDKGQWYEVEDWPAEPKPMGVVRLDEAMRDFLGPQFEVRTDPLRARFVGEEPGEFHALYRVESAMSGALHSLTGGKELPWKEAVKVFETATAGREAVYLLNQARSRQYVRGEWRDFDDGDSRA